MSSRLPEDPRLRCTCQAGGFPQCGWRADAEDLLCEGCRAMCVNTERLGIRPMTFEPYAETWEELLDGGRLKNRAVHLLRPDEPSTVDG